MDIRNKVAVVTGAGAGIGKALALALEGRRCKVVVADIELKKAEAVAREIVERGGTAIATRCDVRDRSSVEALADLAWGRYGEVNLLFNNAGVISVSTTGTLDADTRDFEWVLSVNVMGIWNGCSVFGRRFVKQAGPSWIVNTCSEHGLGVPHAGYGFYTASKHAVVGLSDVLRQELPANVGISVLCPGLVQSELWNADRNRPSKYTDDGVAPVKAFSEALLARGMPAVEVAHKAIEGVERGSFFIVTHPNSREIAERRWSDLEKAFADPNNFRPGDEQYDVGRIGQEIAASLQSDAKAG